jgi:protein kinase C substrate 80K-H
VFLVDNGILAPSSSSGTESKALLDARNALKAGQDDLAKTQKQLSSHEEDLRKDYGPNGIFRALKGQCVSKDSGEYTYELCWLEKTKQKSKKNNAETNLGNFVRIESITVDEALPADGKGLGSGERVALKYENGQHCWNGPSRSTLVVLGCAEKDEVWKVVEEEKCVYRMDVGTPAVCEGSNGNGKGKMNKDEL